MPKYETPEPISVTLELGTGNVRMTAGNRTDTVVEIRPSDEADESDVQAAQQVRADYANGMLRVTGPKPGPFDFSRKTRSVEVSIELPTGSQVSAQVLAGDFRWAWPARRVQAQDLIRERLARADRPTAPAHGVRSRYRRRHRGQRRDLHRRRQDPDRRD